MVNELKTRANIEQQTIIDALGCCLSGVEDNEDKQPFAEGFQNKYPNLVKKCISRNDTIGSIFSVSKQGNYCLTKLLNLQLSSQKKIFTYNSFINNFNHKF